MSKSIANQVISQGSKLVALMGGLSESHIRYVYSMRFKEECVLKK